MSAVNGVSFYTCHLCGEMFPYRGTPDDLDSIKQAHVLDDCYGGLTDTERVAKFLRRHHPEPYCYSCLGKLPPIGRGLSKSVVRKTVSELSRDNEVSRPHGTCSTCGNEGLVVRR